jgi:uncharacterized protein YegL
MHPSRTRSFLLSSALVAIGVAACGGTPNGSDFGRGGDKNGNGAIGDPGTDPPSLGSIDGANGGVNAACVTSSKQAEGSPVYLVFMFDKSGSMDKQSKWTSCATGLKSFFADKSSVDISASLQFFALPNACDVPAYSTPVVPMKTLPDATTFAGAIDGTLPDGDTPTLPALQGAIAYAQQVQQQHAAGKVAVVLVTDGEPNGCGSSVKNVTQAAAAVAKTIPTYVIGVGTELSNLNQIAQGGGTGKAVLISTTNPGSIAQDFSNAIAQVRNALSCEYNIPAPPDGKTIDANNVNVVYTSTAGKTDTLAYNKDCTGAGWHYDDPSSPSKVQICKTSCDTIKADSKGKVDVLFGCATKGGVAR